MSQILNCRLGCSAIRTIRVKSKKKEKEKKLKFGSTFSFQLNLEFRGSGGK